MEVAAPDPSLAASRMSPEGANYGALAADAGDAMAPVSGIEASDAAGAAAMGAGAGVTAGDGGGVSVGADLLHPTRANVATNAAENMILICVSSFLR
jgi:hypothetical protein